MTELHNRPYVQFNFLIDFGAGEPGPHGGFQECSFLEMDPVAKYERAGEERLKVQKLTGINKSANVTMKRGVVRSLSLNEWLEKIRAGGDGALRTVTITLQDEHHKTPGQTWKLRRARIIKHVSGPFNAKAPDVAMEELIIACEGVEMK